MRNKPYFLGGFLILAGYVWTGLSGAERTMPKELIVLRQNDQLRRLKNKFGLTPRSSAAQQ
jgi:hypothetical protein